MNRTITSTEIESLIKKLLTNKKPGPDAFTGELYLTYEEVNTYSSQTTPKNWRWGTLPNSFYLATITLIPKAHKDYIKRILQDNKANDYRCNNPQ